MPVAYDVVINIEDATGKEASTTINVPRGKTLADYTDFARVIAANVDKIVGGLIKGVELCLTADLSGLTLNQVEPSSDVQEVGRFAFATTEGRKVTLNLPGISEQVPYGQTSDEYDQGDPVIASIITLMENGISTSEGVIAPCDVGEDDIVSTIYAREGFRASGSRR